MNKALKPLGMVLMSAAVLAVALPAQGPDQDTLMERRDKKLASEFLKNATWITNYDKARAEAKKSKKLIFGYFTRSYSR